MIYGRSRPISRARAASSASGWSPRSTSWSSTRWPPAWRLAFINKLPDEFKAQVVEQKPPDQEKTPPPPPPDLAKPPPPFVPPPDINIQSEAPSTNAISNVQSRRPAPPPPVEYHQAEGAGPA